MMHDDVIKWKHFQRYRPFVWGIHRSPVNSMHKCQWRWALMLSLIGAQINGWVNRREAGDLRCHHNHYVVTVMWLDPMLYSGYYVHLAPNFLRISVKWATKDDMYQGYVGWIVDQWSHVAITWAAGQGIRAYLNGCDRDADDSKGYAYTMRRTMGSSMWVSFNLVGPSGTTVDELYIWHDLLTSHQIWQLYIQGGTVWSQVQYNARIIPGPLFSKR